MSLSIGILVLLVIGLILCRVFKFSLKAVIKSGGLRFWLWFLLIILLLWLNRYSLMTMVVLLHRDYPFGQALSQSFVMNNNLTFFIEKMYAICAEASIVVPGFLKGALNQVLAGTADTLTMLGDLFDLILLVW